ncbi:hypothetical protein [Rugosimonospora africana]|uniref:Uncharacterized protein n=1 Tax=Rugosimonospora africana TaxID=556532 RepID=A0A8J3R280_9ACTN|nr:hypothetical protein [Rugosimonospora africana]GIH20911.1 hypothetical protein Raf01_90830 [Rugosimonospora africana]
MTTNSLAAPAMVGRRGAQILARLCGDAEFAALRRSSLRYADCWSTYTGYPLIAEWNLDLDAPPLFDEAVKVLALKAAVFELTRDDAAAELLVSPPVDEMVHAVIAQAGLVARVFARAGATVVHQTDHEQFGWTWGDYTQQCYVEAGFGVPPGRYWLDARETRWRRQLLNERYQRIGIGRDGCSHDIKFADPELLTA